MPFSNSWRYSFQKFKLCYCGNMLTENGLFKIFLPINKQLIISTFMLNNRNIGADKRQIVLQMHMIIQLAVGTRRSYSKHGVTNSVHRLQTTCSFTGIRTATTIRIWGNYRLISQNQTFTSLTVCNYRTIRLKINLALRTPWSRIEEWRRSFTHS
jgi:hypothetical protein